MGNELLRSSRGRSSFHLAVLGVRFRRRRASTGRNNAQYASTGSPSSICTTASPSPSRTSRLNTSQGGSSGLTGIPCRCAASITKVLCLCLALWMGTSSQRCAGQVATQQRRAVAFYLRLDPRKIGESDGLAVFRRPTGPCQTAVVGGRGAQWGHKLPEDLNCYMSQAALIEAWLSQVSSARVPASMARCWLVQVQWGPLRCTAN